MAKQVKQQQGNKGGQREQSKVIKEDRSRGRAWDGDVNSIRDTAAPPKPVKNSGAKK